MLFVVIQRLAQSIERDRKQKIFLQLMTNNIQIY